jgi:hypothetical protein
MSNFRCPHCNETVQIEPNQLNCHTFRHGVFKKTIPNTLIKEGIDIPHHATKNLCDIFKKKGLIYGCGKPVQITQINDDGSFIVRPCGYI